MKNQEKQEKLHLQTFRKEGREKKIPRKVIDRIHTILTQYMQGRRVNPVATHDNALEAATSQYKNNRSGTATPRILSKRMEGCNGRIQSGQTRAQDGASPNNNVVNDDGATVGATVQNPIRQRQQGQRGKRR